MDAKSIRRNEDLKKLKDLCIRYPNIIEITNTVGSPIRQIDIALNLPTARDINYPRVVQKRSELKIDFPNNYPFSEPKMTFKTPIWNPNVYSSGLICHGTKWLPTEGLDLLIIWVMKLIIFDPSIVFTGSPANSAASKWYADNLSKGIFPTFSLSDLNTKPKSKIKWVDSAESKDKIISCPSCSKKYKVPLTNKKLLVTCKNCNKKFEVNP